MKKRTIDRKIIIVLIGIMVLFIGASVAPSIWSGFYTTLTGEIDMNSGTTDIEITDYSGTWIYKHLPSDEKVTSSTPIDNPDYMYVAGSWALPGQYYNTFTVTFDNIFPNNIFYADVVFHYIGSIPVKIESFDIDISGDLAPYVYWEAQHVGTGEDIGICDQIHYCNSIHLDIICEIPQDNALQGLQGSGTVSIVLKQWDEVDCGEPELTCCDIELPPDVTFSVSMNSPISYFDVTLTDAGDWNGHYLGWCVDQSTGITPGNEQSGTLWCPWDIDNPYPDNDWDMVAWVINHKHVDATSTDIQHAIWYFIDGGYTDDDPEVLSMIADAEANGEGYQPSVGEICPIVLYSQYQKIFVEVLLEA